MVWRSSTNAVAVWDIHKKMVVACLLTPGERGQPRREVRSFGTTTRSLLELGDWLATAGCTHVPMESTGSYWKPIYNLLEGTGLELLVVNARHIKAVPGRSDRRPRRRVDRRPAPPRPTPGQLHPRSGPA